MSRLLSTGAMLIALSPLNALADQTATQVISQVLYNASADYAYFVGPASWAASACNPYYVQITAGVPYRDKMLAVALAAYAAGKTVSFEGTCDANSSYFDATYIIVSG